jgi:hypothetical protein
VVFPYLNVLISYIYLNDSWPLGRPETQGGQMLNPYKTTTKYRYIGLKECKYAEKRAAKTITKIT